MTERAEALARVCDALLRDDRDGARAIAKREYPFVRASKSGRKYSAHQCMRVFLRDRFIDRYSGARLVFPGALRLLSTLMPEEFPAHPNWKMDDVIPVARGGLDDESNWVTTSMVRNSAKSNWTLEELGWTLRDVDTSSDWDGLVGWSRDYLELHPSHLSDRYIATWHRAAAKALDEGRA